MRFLDAFLHLLNFALPALATGALLALAGWWWQARQRGVGAALRWFWGTLMLNSLAGLVVLVTGLVVLGKDGKMLTYAALVLACGMSQCWRMRGLVARRQSSGVRV